MPNGTKNKRYKPKFRMKASTQHFVDATKILGIKLLDKDIEFIDGVLDAIPYDKRHDVLQHYIDIWLRMMGECENPVAAENFGRRSANLYLLEFLK
jgi:hypothetical protein